MSSAIKDLVNEHETIADERIGGIRHGFSSGGGGAANGVAINVALRFGAAALNPKRQQHGHGHGANRMNFGYDRQARLAAAPGRDAFYADRTSTFARIVPARVPCFERPGLAR